MSSTASITHREAVPVVIGGVRFYCESFRAESAGHISDAATVSGGDVLTNIAPGPVSLTLNCRIADEEQPMRAVQILHNMMRSSSLFSFSYRGLSFTGCCIHSFSADDNGEDFISVSFTLLTPDIIGLEVQS